MPIEFEVFSQSAMQQLQKHDEWDLVSQEALTDDITLPLQVKVIVNSDRRYWTTGEEASTTRFSVIRRTPMWNGFSNGERSTALKRCAQFMERVHTFPLQLPNNWSMFAQDSRVAFYAALPNRIKGRPRWVVQYLPNDIIYFWDLYEGADGGKRKVGDGTIENKILDQVRQSKKVIIEQSAVDLRNWVGAAGHQIQIVPPVTPTAHRQHLKYRDWLQPGKLSAGQDQFVRRGIAEPVKLRGPAGSGKTLALELKMIYDADEALRVGRRWQALYVTHNWALAEQVDYDLESLEPPNGVKDTVEVAPFSRLLRDLRPIPEGVEVLGIDSQDAYEYPEIVLRIALENFLESRFTTFKYECSDTLRRSLEASLDDDQKSQVFRRELVDEFSNVMGGEDIQIRSQDRQKYLALPRLKQWFPLETDGDKHAVYSVYELYLGMLQRENQVTFPQYMATSLRWFDSFEWSALRRSKGYQAIYVDELHLFSQMERTLLGFFCAEQSDSPPIFMATDPAQSPTGRYGISSNPNDVAFGEHDITLREVHRYTPQVLNLIKHFNNAFPAEDMGTLHSVDIEAAQSRLTDGPLPEVTDCRRIARSDIEKTLDLANESLAHGNRLAICIIDASRVDAFMAEADLRPIKPYLAKLRTRDDLGLYAESRRRLTIGHVDYLAGLQFESVIICGLDDSRQLDERVDKRLQFVSRLYLAASRTSQELRIIVNADRDGMPEVLQSAIRRGLINHVIL
jgi:hypothetical protein